MKLMVYISRNSVDGFLEAFVEYSYKTREGRDVPFRGCDLLGGLRCKNVDAAVCRCDKILLDQFKLIEPPAIEYVYGPGVVIAERSNNGLMRGDRVLYTPRAGSPLVGIVQHFTEKRIVVKCLERPDGTALKNPVQVTTKARCLEKL